MKYVKTIFKKSIDQKSKIEMNYSSNPKLYNLIILIIKFSNIRSNSSYETYLQISMQYTSTMHEF